MKNGIRKFIQCLIEFNEMKKVQIMENFTRPWLSMRLAYLYYTCLKSAEDIETLFEILYWSNFFISKLVTNNVELQEPFFV